MRRTIPLLRGLAILGVVFNHANWHTLSQFTAGEVAGYPYVLFDQIGKFAIVAFMFIAGYFTAYATSGGKRDLRWSIVRARLEYLLWPWLIWSGIMLVGQSFQGRPISLAEFMRDLFVHYYFIPLLIFYYLLAPLVVKGVRKNVRTFLVCALAIQLLAVALFYARVYLPSFPDVLNSWVDVGPLQYLRFAFYFPFGVVCGMFPQKVKAALARFKSHLPWATALLFALSFLETSLVYNAGGQAWPIGGDQTKLSSALFSTFFILLFVVFARPRVPYSRGVINLGTRSYGLYLSHYPILGILAKLMKHVMPSAASQEWILLPVLFAMTVTLAVLLMESVTQLPTKRFYRYVFG